LVSKEQGGLKRSVKKTEENQTKTPQLVKWPENKGLGKGFQKVKRRKGVDVAEKFG